MTKTDFDTKYSPIIMPEPFAGSGNKTFPANTQDDASGFSYPLGFSDAYSSPRSNNGKYVTRKQMNAIGNLATHNDFYHRCGGLNTFDPAFAEAIGGYPKGATLQYFNGSDVLTLISLVDNNKSNFITDGISLDHWRVSGDKIRDGYFVGLSYNSTVVFSSLSIQVIGSFKAPLSGTVTIADLKVSYLMSENDESTGIYDEGVMGGGVCALKNSSDFSKDNYTNVNLLSGFGSALISWGSGAEPSYSPLQCSSGDIITIGIQNGWVHHDGYIFGRSITISFEIRIV